MRGSDKKTTKTNSEARFKNDGGVLTGSLLWPWQRAVRCDARGHDDPSKAGERFCGALGGREAVGCHPLFISGSQQWGCGGHDPSLKGVSVCQMGLGPRLIT